MSRQRSSSIGSYTRRNEYYSFSIEINKTLQLARWKCSCGESTQDWISIKIPWFRSILTKRWYKHVTLVHPEVGDEDYED